jgi:hypothetical protein
MSLGLGGINADDIASEHQYSIASYRIASNHILLFVLSS